MRQIYTFQIQEFMISHKITWKICRYDAFQFSSFFLYDNDEYMTNIIAQMTNV